MNPATMTLPERNYFGLEPADHVVVFQERKRLARIMRDCNRAARRR